jgi:hypothetical protein
MHRARIVSTEGSSFLKVCRAINKFSRHSVTTLHCIGSVMVVNAWCVKLGGHNRLCFLTSF